MKRLNILIPLLLFSCSVWAQERSFVSDIRFIQGHGNIEVVSQNNRESLDSLGVLLREIKSDTTLLLTSIEIEAFASPEGSKRINTSLAQKRCNAMEQYIRAIIDIPDSLLKKSSQGVAWDRLRAMVVSSEMPYRDMVLNIIDNYPELTWKDGIIVNSRNKRLMDLKGGVPYNYMMKNFFPDLRGAIVITISHKMAPVQVLEDIPITPPDTMPQQNAEQPQPQENTIINAPVIEVKQRKPLFALKTNLLFDLASILNVEVEVPIGNRWSVAGEWMLPWWRNSKSNFTMQLLTGHGEVKYWLGNRMKHETMTGWNLGLYGGGGKYDFQIFNDDGAQGDFFDIGVSIGYAHKISRNFRMEYSLGFGYLCSDYEAYHWVRNTQYGDIKVVDYPWETHRLNWFGPTRARVSLVWMLHYKKKEVAK